jgi:regulator of replication initiation timing
MERLTTKLSMRWTDLKEIIRKLSKENTLLKEENEKLKERDVESDIADIKRILDSYGEDLTSLRINQGHIVESIDEHSLSLANINTALSSNAEKFASHDQIFVEHQTFMGENRAIIDSHTQIVNDHQGFIQANIQGITNNANRIQENVNGIVKNTQDIQAVLDTFNYYKSSQVKFVAETPYGGGEYNPENVRLTFAVKHLDTHNALSDSQFFAPISGLYGFIFTADFRLYDERDWQGFIHVNVNEAQAKVYMFDSRNDDEIWQAYSIFFVLFLNQGDRVDISTSGEPCYDISRNPATLMGYLM